MKKYKPISDSEYVVMNQIWQADHPLTIKEITSSVQQVKDWKYPTIQTYVLRLRQKGLLKHEVRERGNVFYYSPKVGQNEYCARLLKQIIEDTDGASCLETLRLFLEGTDWTKEDQKALKKIVDHMA